MVSIVLTSRCDDAERRERIYRGDIFLFRSVPAMGRLVEFVHGLAERELGADPETAHDRFPRAELSSRVDRLQRAYTNSPAVRNLWRDALMDCGLSVPGTYWDWPPLRVQPPGGPSQERQFMGLPPHRDTWYGRIFCQNNWWGPLYPLEPQRSLSFYPRYWNRPVENTSRGFHLERFRKERAEASRTGRSMDSGRAWWPGVTSPADLEDQLRILLEPGDLVSFSGAHLHFGEPNGSCRIRFSTEVRTVYEPDFLSGYGALNVDTYSEGSAFGDFLAIQ